MIYQEDIDFLEHYGVKGQRWGVRRDRRANTLKKVGSGKGSGTEKLRAYTTVSPLDVARGRGFKGAAKLRGERQLSRNARIRKGEASVRDILVYYGGTKHQDLIPTNKKKTNTKAALGASIAGVVLVSIGSNAIGAALKTNA
jgi:hypothetical protein